VKISIIGAAGTVGSCAAFNIGIHKITDELVMIGNRSRGTLENYVTDLSTAATGLDTLVRAGSYEDMVDSNIVVICAGSSQVMADRKELLTQNLSIIKDIALRVKKYCPNAIVITATNPIDPMNYGMFLSSGLDRKQCIGYSINDSIRFRMFLAEALKVKSSQIEATVMGEHGVSQVLLFSSVKVSGKTVKVSPEKKQWIKEQVANLPKMMESQRVKSGRTQGWTTSMGLTAMCKSISQNTGEVMPGSVILDGEYGYTKTSISVPIAFGKDGVREIKVLELTPEEKEGLERSVKSIRQQMEFSEIFLAQK
jgi:malate dehydrogenase